MHLLLLAIVHAAEARAIAQRPVDWVGVDAEHGFQFIEQIHGWPGGAVQFVHESEDRHAAAAADFKEFARLAFDALARIDHHHGGIDGSEYPVGVFREIFVPRGVEDVDDAVLVLELQDRRADRDAALLFQIHPVGGGGALVFACGDAAREVERAAVEQEFLSQCRLAGIRVGNDRKRAAALHLTLDRG